MQLVNIWKLLIHLRFPMAFAELDCLVSLTHVVIESTYVKLVTSMLITHYPLVFVWMIEPLDGRVTFLTFNSFRAQIPSQTIDESITVFRCILEQIWRPSEISGVMCEITTLRVVWVFLSRAPTCLVIEHKENVALLLVICVIEVFVQVIKCQETVGNKIVFYAFVLEVPVYCLYIF